MMLVVEVLLASSQAVGLHMSLFPLRSSFFLSMTPVLLFLASSKEKGQISPAPGPPTIGISAKIGACEIVQFLCVQNGTMQMIGSIKQCVREISEMMPQKGPAIPAPQDFLRRI